MIEKIKDRIWGLLQDREVSLALVFDMTGRILWRCGRPIYGDTVENGTGFSRSSIMKALQNRDKILEEGCFVQTSGHGLSETAMTLKIKSVLVFPVADRYFLYLDSGTRDTFRDKDLGAIETLVSILGDIVASISAPSAHHSGLSGRSAAAEAVRQKIVDYAIEDEPVLLLGPTGVGKGRIAESIHTFSGRSGAFVMIHAPTVPPELFSAELFGIAKGAPGVPDGRSPILERAERGTLYIDEVTAVPRDGQLRLLHLIENGVYSRLASSEEQAANVRIIASSTHDLSAEIARGDIDEKFFYRLRVLSIHIPPLQERPEDLADLIEEHRALLRGHELSPEALALLQKHHWPGNVLELINVLKQAGIDARKPAIGKEISRLLEKPGRRNPLRLLDGRKPPRH